MTSSDIAFEKIGNLPKLPVPPLEPTLKRYIEFLEPILTTTQLERAKGLVKSFGAPGGLGPTLQQILLDRREREDNWAYEYWINDMYLENRLPLPINSNPGMVLTPRKFTTVHDVARFAARLIDGAVDHQEMLDSGQLQQEKATSNEKGQPLCMAQYYRLLGSCRIPGYPRDSQYFSTDNKKDLHVIVTCRNQMYCLPVIAADRGRLSEDEISSQLVFVLSDAPCLAQTPHPIGLLTSRHRDDWAKDRELLLQVDDRNRHNLQMIERALLIVCLDESLPTSFNAPETRHSKYYSAGGRDETNMAHEMIHGGGSQLNSPNRWFDKTVQLVICNDGSWGLCYEHSPSEGGAVVQLVEKLSQRADEVVGVDDSRGGPHSHIPPPERLEWTITSTLRENLKRAAHDLDCSIEDFDFLVYRFADYGKEFIKSCKCSPDAYIQLSLQLAYYKLYGHLVSTYESASTRRFKLGRVDCIRSASVEASLWAAAMCQGEGPADNITNHTDDFNTSSKKVTFSLFSVEKRRELFKNAIIRQTETMKENILGKGIDIHLLGLRQASIANTGTIPELFQDESYKIANCFTLSTSQVACGLDSFMGYGPVTPAGYGASYNPRADEIVFCLSAFKSAEHTSTTAFSRAISEALCEMKTLLQEQKN